MPKLKRSTLISLGATFCFVMAVLWFFNRPVDPLVKDDASAKSAGFSSGKIFTSGLRLTKKVRETKSLSNNDFGVLRKLVQDEGESGQLLALTIILPLHEADQMRRALEACREAVLNEKIDIMPSRVLSSYRNRDRRVFDEFAKRNPSAIKIVEAEK